MGVHSIPKPIDHASVSEGPNPDADAWRTTAQRSGVSVEHFSKYAPVGTRVRQAHLGKSDRNGVSSPTCPAPEGDQDPISPFAHVQVTDLAMPVTEEVSHTNIPSSEMKAVQAPKRQKLNITPISAPDNPSVMEAFSLQSTSPRRDAAIFSSTTPDGHGRNDFEFPRNSPRLSPADGIPSTAGVRQSIVAPSSSRTTGDFHEAGENPVPRMPAEFDTSTRLDVSNITSPGDTPSRQSHHASRGSHMLPTEPRPSSSNILVKEPKARKTVNSDRRSRKAPSKGGGSKQAKDKPKLITPLEYAQKLQSCLDLHPKFKTNYLKGKRIFYVGGDMMYASTTTRGRMEYVSHLYILSSHCHLRRATDHGCMHGMSECGVT